MIPLRALLFGLLVPIAAMAKTDTYWDQHNSGWFWYATPPIEPEIAPLPIPLADQKPSISEIPPEVAAHEKLQRQLENTRSVAIMNPTLQNVTDYLLVQQEVMQRSARFADVWQRVIWTTPELDYSVTNRPTNAAALHTWNRELEAQRTALVADAAQTHGLFFVFGPDCIYCAQIAQALRRVSGQFGFTVQAVAVAGAVNEDFPDAWPDNGFVEAAQISSLPAIVLASLAPGHQQLTLLASGPLADDELIERIAVLTGVPIGDRF